MKIILAIVIITFIIGLICIICACIVSGRISRKEEQYRSLDAKKLDDEIKWDEDIYDEYFIKKEGENENE